MSLLSTHEVKQKIADEVSHSNETLQIVSAFCKIRAMEFIDRNIKNCLKSKKLMVRFLLSDILQGATDFSLFEYCKANGWEMYVRFDLHAKTYIFDRQRCILGSANLTSNGLGLGVQGNYELSSFTTIDDSDMYKIDNLFKNAILMTDEIYATMKKDIHNSKQNGTNINFRWSNNIEELFNPKIEVLFTYDFPNVAEPDLSDLSTMEFLEIHQPISFSELQHAFRWSKAFMWLYNYLSSCSNGVSYFGAVTAAMHNTLINDPKPYRKEVKDLLGNLLNWIQILDIKEIVIDKPNYSQRISLAKRTEV